MADRGQPCEHGFDDDVVDFGFEVGDVDVLFLEGGVEGGEGTFVADGHVLGVGVEDEVRGVFVDRVVGQVHADVLHVVAGREDVGLGGETRKALFEDVDAERVDGGNEDVKPQVEFQVVDEVRFAHVPLDHIVLPRLQILQPPRQEYPLPLRHRLRFHNISPRLPFGFPLKIQPKLRVLRG